MKLPALASLVLVLAFAPLAAQEPTATLDVVVTDGRGNGVPGLQREDFKLFEAGRPVEVSQFEAFAPPDPKAAPPGSRSEAQRLHLVVFVDNLHLKPTGRDRTLKQVQGFLEKSLQPDDRILIATFDPGLKIRRPFSETARPWADDLRQLAREKPHGPEAETARRKVLYDLQRSDCSDESVAKAKDYAQQSQAETEETLTALRRFVDSLAGLPGRKAILYVSEGFPQRPEEYVGHLLADGCGLDATKTLRIGSLADELRRLTNAANAARATFYSLEATGLRLSSSAGVGDDGPADSAVESVISPKGKLGKGMAGWANLKAMQAGGVFDAVEKVNLQNTLLSLARETGGQAFLDNRDLGRGLQSLGRELRQYYSLAFTPQPGGEGQDRELKVEVAKPGLKVRARRSSGAALPEERLLAGLEAALWHGVEANPLAVRMAIGPARLEEGGRYSVPVEIKIPVRSVTLTPGDGQLHGRLEVKVVSRDAEGREAVPQHFEVPLDLPQAQVEASSKAVLRHEVSLEMLPGSYVVALSVRDETGGAVSYLRQEAQIGTPAPAGAGPSYWK